MGVDKATVVVGSATMIDHVVAALDRVVDEVVAVGPPRTDLPVPSLADTGPPHQGPLAGLASAVEHFPDSLLVVVAVDQPWVRADTLARLISIGGSLPVLPVDDGIRQTTCAIYPTQAMDGVRDELEGGGSIQSLLDRISFRPVVEEEWEGWGEDGRSWFSADAATDIDEGLRRYGNP